MTREHSDTKRSGQKGEIVSLLHRIRYDVGNILLTGLVFLVFGVLLTESMSIVLTRTLPAVNVHIAAAAIGLLFGYAAAVTVALWEVVRGLIGSVERIVTEIEHAGAQLNHSIESFSSASNARYSDLAHSASAFPLDGMPSRRVNDLATITIRPLERVVE